MNSVKTRRSRQAGVAILFAMLIVTLVASFVAAALWQQSSDVDNESAQRGKLQASLIHAGVLNWARLLLIDDLLAGELDHLGETWAKPLQAAQLSLFLSQDNQTQAGAVASQARASGQLSDLQARLNVMNLIEKGKISASAQASFERLFDLLRLPRQQLTILSGQLLKASQVPGALTADMELGEPPAPLEGDLGEASAPAEMEQGDPSGVMPASPQTVLMPHHVDQLVWLGISPDVLASLRPHITLLPTRTTVNLNTASAEVIYASTPGLQLAEAKMLVSARDSSPFQSPDDVNRLSLKLPQPFTSREHSVKSQYFELRSTLELDQTTTQVSTILVRGGASVIPIWSRAGAPPSAPSKAPNRQGN